MNIYREALQNDGNNQGFLQISPQVNPNLGIAMKTHSCSSMILPAKCPFGSLISDCHFRLADGIDYSIVDHSQPSFTG